MTAIGWFQILLFAVIIALCAKPLGAYIYAVLESKNHFLSRLLRPLETNSYRLVGIDPHHDMTWIEYTQSLLAFSLVSLLFTYAVLRLQGLLPFNPMQFSTANAPSWATALTPDLAFNTAMSFTTNTNWQAYSGENTLSYLSQMLGLAFHNWVSAAAGIVVAVALIRGFARRTAQGLGNFWADMTRTCLYILLPICFVYSLFLVYQGVPQNFNAYTEAATIEGSKQIIPQGPIASQESIKMLGTNGGGFLNANSSHPFENPTPLSNFIQLLSIFLIPAALTYTFGRAIGDTRQGWTLLSAMFLLFFAGVFICYHFEAQGNPNVARQNVEISTKALGDTGGNMEGKEVRFGLANSALFATVTTDASCGAVNSMHDSYTPLGGLIPLLNIQLGEIVFGGVGAGLYGMLIYAVLTVFIAGLMVGRTPEYVGKKIEKKEVKMAMLFVLAAAFCILVFTGLACVLNLPEKSFLNPQGATWNNINNSGPHGLSEILYAFSSATGNNGSAFAGISVNTPFYNTLLALAMFVGRFLMIVPVLAMAGSLAQKKYVPATSGTFPTYTWLFTLLLISIILIVGALTFFPALTLGPIVEHFLMNEHRLF
ncbi:MAG: potassium-transporting ATPase subunit KdpA [Candidatus Obscuribacterales bacterium]|nr:potassium-transporting ATPase subunit KdpA [Candidatus Obscuribacterales bacterium]